MNGARYAYLRKICHLVEQGKDIVIVSEDYAAPMFDGFRVQYPERFLSAGIAEQNGMAVACGLALAGKYPIVYGCAPFPLTRAVDQLKSAVAGMHLPMTILNSGIGFGVPEFGATHFNTDDIAIVRGVPGVRIVTPSDNTMAELLADYSLLCETPLYVRFDKYSEGKLYEPSEIDFVRGIGLIKDPGSTANVVLITCGSMVQDCLNIAKAAASNGVYAKVVDLYTIPFDEAEMLCVIGDLPVVTVEEHNVNGGIGTAILEMFNRNRRQNNINRVGIDFKQGYPVVSGSRDYFMKEFGLTAEEIQKALTVACKRKE